MHASDLVRVAAHPFRTYRRLGVRSPATSELWTMARGPLMWLLVIGSFVSWVSAGRLVWYHIVLPLTAWGVFPVMQAAFVVLTRAQQECEDQAHDIIDWYFVGQGPWYLFLLLVAGICLFAPSVWPIFEWSLDTGAIFVALGVTFAWSTFLTFALFRSALDLGFFRGVAATLGFTLLYGGCIVFYFAMTGQLRPLLAIGAP